MRKISNYTRTRIELLDNRASIQLEYLKPCEGLQVSLSGIARLGSCVLLAPQQIYLAWGDRKSCLWKQELSETNRCVGMTRRRARRFERSLRNVEFSLVRPRCEDRGRRKFTITAASDGDDQNRLMFCLFWYKTKLKVFILASISYRLYS